MKTLGRTAVKSETIAQHKRRILWGREVGRSYKRAQVGTGIPKKKALKKAQMEVRTKYPGPFNWMAFVLLE